MKNTTAFSLLTCFVGCLHAQPLPEPERSRIAAERNSAQAGFAREDSACYEKFWVNHCLDEVKSRRLALLADLRRQEVALNDQERKAQGADQLQKIEEKASLARQQVQADARAEAFNKAAVKAGQQAQKAGIAASPEAALAARAQGNKADAADRLADNQRKLADRAQKQSQDAEEARKFSAKQIRAKERQEKNRASRAGKTPAPPLPLAPSLTR